MLSLAVGVVAPLAALGQSADRREDVVFRDAYVMTMDALGDIAEGDVLVQDGRIADVGMDLEAPGAREIEGRGRF